MYADHTERLDKLMLDSSNVAKKVYSSYGENSMNLLIWWCFMHQVKEALKQLEAGGAEGSKETSGTLLQKKIYKNVQGSTTRAESSHSRHIIFTCIC